MKTGFTLHELIIVLVITGILVAIGVPSYIGMQEDSYNREAITNLRRLQEAEKFYKVEFSSYYQDLLGTSTGINNINTNLTVSLPKIDPLKWYYIVSNNGCAEARRNGGDNRTWRLRVDEDDPTKGSTCP